MAAQSLLAEIRAKRSRQPQPAVLSIDDIVGERLSRLASRPAVEAMLRAEDFSVTIIDDAKAVTASCGDADILIVAKAKLQRFRFVAYDEAVILVCYRQDQLTKFVATVAQRSL